MKSLNLDSNIQKFFEEAGKIALQARCKKACCGAVIEKEGEILGAGYNAPPLDLESECHCNDILSYSDEPKYDRTCCMHAEWRAILSTLKTHGDKIQASRLFFTRVDVDANHIKSGLPFCTVCSRLALDVGIKSFVLWHENGIIEYDTEEYNRLSYEYHQKFNPPTKPEVKPKKGIYRHFKGGLYRVVLNAKHSESLEEMVVYQKLDGEAEGKKGTFWVRPLSMFIEEVERDGKTFPRFKYLGENLHSLKNKEE